MVYQLSSMVYQLSSMGGMGGLTARKKAIKGYIYIYIYITFM